MLFCASKVGLIANVNEDMPGPIPGIAPMRPVTRAKKSRNKDPDALGLTPASGVRPT